MTRPFWILDFGFWIGRLDLGFGVWDLKLEI